MIGAMADDSAMVAHAMLCYAEPGAGAAACAEFVRAGLAEHAAVLVAGTGEFVERLRPRVGEAGAQVTIAELPRAGADPGRLLSVIRAFTLKQAGRPVRLVQEVGWAGRPAEEFSEALGYETLLSLALAGSAASVLCAYHGRLDGDLLASAELAHQDSPQHGRCGGSPASPGTGALALSLSLPPRAARTRSFRRDQAEVRQFAEDQGRRAGLTRDRLTDLVLIVGELAGNTLRHTAGPGVLTTWATTDEFVCQVADQGQISDPLAGTLSPDPAESGGRRGLWLVHQIGDLVQLRSGADGTTVRVHLRLPGAGRPAPGADA